MQQVFYVYMENNTNRADDEVYRVLATSVEDAKRVARSKMEWLGRFSIGWALPANPEDKQEAEFLKSYTWWATDKT